MDLFKISPNTGPTDAGASKWAIIPFEMETAHQLTASIKFANDTRNATNAQKETLGMNVDQKKLDTDFLQTLIQLLEQKMFNAPIRKGHVDVTSVSVIMHLPRDFLVLQAVRMDGVELIMHIMAILIHVPAAWPVLALLVITHIP